MFYISRYIFKRKNQVIVKKKNSNVGQTESVDILSGIFYEKQSHQELQSKVDSFMRYL